MSPIKSFGLGDTLSVVAIQSPTRVQQQINKRITAFHSASSMGGKKGEAVIIHRQDLTYVPLPSDQQAHLRSVKGRAPDYSADHAKIFNVPSLQQQQQRCPVAAKPAPFEMQELEQQAKAITSKLLDAQDVKISKQQIKVQNRRSYKRVPPPPVTQTQHQPYGQQPRISVSASNKFQAVEQRCHPMSEMKAKIGGLVGEESQQLHLLEQRSLDVDSSIRLTKQESL